VTEFTHISNIELNDHEDANGMDENDNFDRKDSHDTVVDESMIPPKPPRTAFMCFTDAKKKELLLSSGSNIRKKTKQGQQDKNKGEDDDDEDEVLKIVAVAWKNLDDNTRAYWDEETRNDKVRYVFFISLACFCVTRTAGMIFDFVCLIPLEC
jgi:hypothetical protein